jgi:hypothetical protein
MQMMSFVSVLSGSLCSESLYYDILTASHMYTDSGKNFVKYVLHV